MTTDKVADKTHKSAIEPQLDAIRDTRFASLLIVLGFACFWCALITAVGSSAFMGEGAPAFDHHFLRFALLVGLALIQFFAYARVLNRVSENVLQRFVRVLALLATLLFCAVSFLSAFGAFRFSPGILAAVWLCFGVSCGLSLVAWGIAWTRLDAERPDSHLSALNMAASILLAVVLSGFMSFAPSKVAMATACALYLVSLALQAYCMKLFAQPEEVDVATSKQRLKLFSPNMLAPLFIGASFGFVSSVALTAIHEDWFFGLYLASVAVGAAVVLLVLIALKRIPRFSSIERFIFPVLSGLLLLLPFVEGLLQAVVVGLIIADAVCYFIVHWNILIVLSYRHHLRPSYHYAQGLISPLGGIVIGWGIVGALSFGLGLPLSATILVVALSLVFLLILVLSIVPYTSYKEVEAIAGAAEDEAYDKAGSWKRRSQTVCDRYALTPREQEVFILLAKGRNTEVIARQLVISAHTVKTHTSRIYRKLLISSQQGLIDIVERTEL